MTCVDIKPDAKKNRVIAGIWWGKLLVDGEVTILLVAEDLNLIMATCKSGND